jgi:hypothetical protein
MMAHMNRREYEELRRWGQSLRQEEREEMRAAGQAIRLLCGEVDRLEFELSAARAALAAQPPEAESAEVDDTVSDEPDLMDASLRSRLQRRLSTLHRGSTSPDPEAQ